MSQRQLLEDPTNRVVSVFDQREGAEVAVSDLSDVGCALNGVQLFSGNEAADKIDTSAKWFADTDAELRRYERELRAGRFVVSVPIADAECREAVHGVLKRHNARLITHFGDWVTEMMR